MLTLEEDILGECNMKHDLYYADIRRRHTRRV